MKAHNVIRRMKDMKAYQLSDVDKSLNALRRAFNKISSNDLDKIVKKVKSMNIQGPTVDEYFKSLDSLL